MTKSKHTESSNNKGAAVTSTAIAVQDPVNAELEALLHEKYGNVKLKD